MHDFPAVPRRVTILDSYSPEELRRALKRATSEQAHVIRLALRQEVLESDYETWLYTLFPNWATSPLGDHHREMWEWGWKPKEGAPAFIAAWGRGGAKSSSAELLVASWAVRKVKKYVLYVSETQDLADKHVESISGLFESDTVGEYYPSTTERMVGKYGSSKGWRRNRVRMANGFTVDAIGLDTASRGIKIEESRPDVIVLDDIDGIHDTIESVKKKIQTITGTLIPAGADDVLILFVQNLIHANSVASQVLDGRADMLQYRQVSGPIPALREFSYTKQEDGTYRIITGIPTWVGFNVQRCERMLNKIGVGPFLNECQHDVHRVEGAKWSKDQLAACRVAIENVPELEEVIVFVDPSGGDTVEHDEQGIIVMGRGIDGHGYVLADLSGHFKTKAWADRSIMAYRRAKADLIGVEDNYGGEMCEFSLRTQFDKDEEIPIKRVNARRGKILRAGPVASCFGDPDRPDEWRFTRIHLAGSFTDLENEMTSYTGLGKSPNRLDAFVHAATSILNLSYVEEEAQPFFGVI